MTLNRSVSVCLLGFLVGCDTYVPPPPGTTPSPKPAAAAQLKARDLSATEKSLAAETTRDFFGRIEKKELGDVDGKLDLRDDGILIHPGRTKPTAISFRLSGEYDLLRLRLSIPDLGTDGNAVADAGNVNVQIAIDGKTVLREHIERDSSLDREVPAKLGRELTVTVDNANGKPWWDWFFLSFLSTQRANAR